VIRNFVPAFIGRGVVQINAYTDQFIATFLPNGAVSLLFYAQTVSILPVSLFGMAVSASELPEMSSSVGDKDATAAHVRGRLDAGLRQIAFFVVPSAAAFLVLGDVIAAALFQSGRFTRQDTLFTWGILAAAAVGLMATTLGRLYSSAFYALHDTRTPLRFALARVTLATVLGYVFAIHVPGLLGIAPQWGAAALTLSSGLAGWLEFTLLRSRLNSRIGRTGLSSRYVLTLWAVALASGGTPPASAVRRLIGRRPPSIWATAPGQGRSPARPARRASPHRARQPPGPTEPRLPPRSRSPPPAPLPAWR